MWIGRKQLKEVAATFVEAAAAVATPLSSGTVLGLRTFDPLVYGAIAVLTNYVARILDLGRVHFR
jgi:hypothetical protein